MDTIKTLLEDNMDFANWGFEQFAIVATGVAAASGIAKYAPNKKEFAALVKSALAYYYSAIDPNVSSSFANALAVLTSQQTSLSTRIDSYFETFWNSGVGDEFNPPHGPPKSFVYIYKCHGNIQTSVTGEDHASRPDTGGGVHARHV